MNYTPCCAEDALLVDTRRHGAIRNNICHHGIWQHIEHRYRDIDAFKIYASDTGRLCAKSLRVYMDTYHPAYAVKLSTKNFGMKDNKKCTAVRDILPVIIETTGKTCMRVRWLRGCLRHFSCHFKKW